MNDKYIYQKGYEVGYREGYNKALEILVDRERNRIETKVIVSMDGKKIVEKEELE